MMTSYPVWIYTRTLIDRQSIDRSIHAAVTSGYIGFVGKLVFILNQLSILEGKDVNLI